MMMFLIFFSKLLARKLLGMHQNWSSENSSEVMWYLRVKLSRISHVPLYSHFHKRKREFVLIQCFKRKLLQGFCFEPLHQPFPSQDRPQAFFCLTHSFPLANWFHSHRFVPGPKRFCLCHGMTWANIRLVTFICLWQMPLTFPWAEVFSVVIWVDINVRRNTPKGKV